MKKKLPEIFPGQVKKNSGNNIRVFDSSKDDNINKLSNRKITNKNINQKLNNIFNSSTYVYKADVEIVLTDKTVSKRIIGRNKTHLITIENELIPIANIIDIYKK